MKVSHFFIYCLLMLSFELMAAPVLTTSKNINITQSLGTLKTASSNDSINLTTITPRYSLLYTKSKIDLVADYSLVASRDNENSESNISHQLNLSSTYTHIPNSWTSRFSSNIFQKNLTDNGLLVTNTTTSDASESYTVNTINTDRKFLINRNMNLNSSINLSSQGFKSESKNKNVQMSLQLNILRLFPSISLSTSIKSNKNLDSKQSNSSIDIRSNYLINAKLKSFISATKNTDETDQFTDTRYQFGLNWEASSNSQFNIGIGRFGDVNSWSTDSFINLKRTTFSLTHSEEVAPANQTLLNNLNTGSNTFSNGTGNALKFIKNTSLSISHKARRLVTQVSVSHNQQFTDIGITADRTSSSNSLSLNYQLNRLNSMGYSFSTNTIKTTINNKLIQHSVNWSSKVSRHSQYNVSIDIANQESDLASLETQKNQLNLNYSLVF